MELKDRPYWLNHKVVVEVLRSFLEKLNRLPLELREKSLYESTHSHRLRTLHEPIEPGEDEALWSAIEMAISDGIFELKEGKRQPWEPIYKNAKLKFISSYETDIRLWLEMPKPEEKTPWQIAVEEAGPDINRDLLSQTPIIISGKSSVEVVEALTRMRQSLIVTQEQLTLRQLSAKHLWSVSKALDSRGESWLAAVFNIDESLIRPRPVHVSVLLPKVLPKGIMFIENQDTFDQFCRLSVTTNNYAIVYLSGFKGTASRVRSEDGVRFLFSGLPEKEVFEYFHHLWFRCPQLECIFWGDLDYAGLNIAISLKRIFPKLTWYKAAYVEMLYMLESGLAHEFDDQSKGYQIRPNEDLLWDDEGKGYLAAIDEHGGFVDQESVVNKELFY